MIKYEDECVGCTTMGLPCQGYLCPNRHVPHYYCDRCGEEEQLFYYEGLEVCLDCIKKDLTEVIAGEYIDY